MARRNVPVTRLRLCAHSKMVTYWLKNHLLTPRKGRRKLRNPVQIPSSVLSWTSRTPSPSASRAHSRWPGVWQTVGWVRPVAGSWSYARHASVLTVASGRVCASTKGCKAARSLWSHTCKRIWPLSRPTTPAIGTRSVSQLPCPRVLFARRRGGSAGSACLRPFSPAFWYSSSASVTSSGSGPEGGKVLRQHRLDVVAPRQQMAAINPHLRSHVLGRHALRDATQDLDDGRTGVTALRPDGPREEVEDGATGPTAVVQDGGTMPVMGGLIGGQAMSVRTAQPVRMQDVQQEVVAGVLIQQIVERKLQHRGFLPHALVLYYRPADWMPSPPAPQSRHEPRLFVLSLWPTEVTC